MVLSIFSVHKSLTVGTSFVICFNRASISPFGMSLPDSLNMYATMCSSPTSPLMFSMFELYQNFFTELIERITMNNPPAQSAIIASSTIIPVGEDAHTPRMLLVPFCISSGSPAVNSPDEDTSSAIGTEPPTTYSAIDIVANSSLIVSLTCFLFSSLSTITFNCGTRSAPCSIDTVIADAKNFISLLSCLAANVSRASVNGVPDFTDSRTLSIS